MHIKWLVFLHHKVKAIYDIYQSLYVVIFFFNYESLVVFDAIGVKYFKLSIWISVEKLIKNELMPSYQKVFEIDL